MLKKLNIFYENGKLRVELDGVWDNACKLLDDKIKCKNLYLFVQQKRRLIQNKLRAHFNIPDPEQYKMCSDDDFEDDPEDDFKHDNSAGNDPNDDD